MVSNIAFPAFTGEVAFVPWLMIQGREGADGECLGFLIAAHNYLERESHNVFRLHLTSLLHRLNFVMPRTPSTACGLSPFLSTFRLPRGTGAAEAHQPS